MEERTLWLRAEREMIGLGFDSYYKGYYYICLAVLYWLDYGYRKVSLRKEIYQRIAEDAGTTIDSVEACIRNSVTKAWNRNEAGFRRALKPYQGRARKKPTNAEMIAIIASRIRLERMNGI